MSDEGKVLIFDGSGNWYDDPSLSAEQIALAALLLARGVDDYDIIRISEQMKGIPLPKTVSQLLSDVDAAIARCPLDGRNCLGHEH